MLERSWEFGSPTVWQWLLLTFGLLVACICLWLDRRHKLLGALTLTVRLGILAWLALPFLGLAMWQVQWEPQPGKFAILVDQSASVQLRPNTNSAIRRAADQLRQDLSEFATVSEIFYVGRGVTEPWLYGADSSAAAGGPTQLLTDLTRLAADVADGSQSLILLTDGADHGLADAKAVTANVAAVILPELDDDPSPILLADVETDAYALIRSPLRFTVLLKRTPSGPSRAEVAVANADIGLGVTQVVFAPGMLTATAQLDVLPTLEGRQVFTVSVKHHELPFTAEFHETRVSVRVIRDRIRILHVVGRPSWETRLLRENLRRDPVVDLVSFQILRTVKDNPKARDVELSLIPFPTKELFSVELPKFDVVMFQNFDYASYFDANLANMLLTNLRNFVVNDGGGFVMTAGDLSFGYGNYHYTPLRDILPVDWRGLGQWTVGEFALSDTRWAEWFGVPAPESRVIKRVYQTVPGAKSRTIWQSGGLPAFVVGTAGQGRTAAVLTDDLWRLAYAGSPSDRAAIASFWSRLIRYLAGDPEFEDRHVQWQSLAAMPGLPVRGTLQPATDTAILLDENGDAIADLVTPGGKLDFRAPDRQTALRIQTMQTVAPEPVIVQYPLPERTNLAVDRTAWQNWAKAQRADLVWLEDWHESGLLERLKRHSQRVVHRDFVPVQEFWWYWVALALMLCAEVATRRLLGAA